MTARSKINESNYNLNKLINIEQTLSDEYTFEFNCFLASAKSIFDHLLDDYAVKYDLKIPLDARDLRKEFHERAKNNEKAVNFYKWFESEYDDIVHNPEFGFLLKKRDIFIHRKNMSPKKVAFYGEGLSITSNNPNEAVDVRIGVIGKQFKAIQTTTNKKTLEQTEKILDTKIHQKAYLEENPDQPINTICRLLLKRITKFVDEAYNKFP